MRASEEPPLAGGREGTADFFGLADWSTWTPYARKPRKKLPCCEMAWRYLSGTVIVSVMVSIGVGAFLTELYKAVKTSIKRKGVNKP